VSPTKLIDATSKKSVPMSFDPPMEEEGCESLNEPLPRMSCNNRSRVYLHLHIVSPVGTIAGEERCYIAGINGININVLLLQVVSEATQILAFDRFSTHFLLPLLFRSELDSLIDSFVSGYGNERDQLAGRVYINYISGSNNDIPFQPKPLPRI
jgi:hypothetical protein